MMVNHKQLLIEVDTGAAVSILCEEVTRATFVKAKLQLSTLPLKIYLKSNGSREMMVEVRMWAARSKAIESRHC